MKTIRILFVCFISIMIIFISCEPGQNKPNNKINIRKLPYYYAIINLQLELSELPLKDKILLINNKDSICYYGKSDLLKILTVDDVINWEKK
jgi:hypothetical protein